MLSICFTVNNIAYKDTIKIATYYQIYRERTNIDIIFCKNGKLNPAIVCLADIPQEEHPKTYHSERESTKSGRISASAYQEAGA